MLQACLVDLDPAGLVGERTVADKVGSDLRWADMDHVETDRLFGDSAVGSRVGKPSFLTRPINRKQLRCEVQVGAIFFYILHQRRHIVLHTEQNRSGIVEMDRDIVDPALSKPVIARQIHRFLRSSGAFDRHGRLGEEGATALEVLDQKPGIGGNIIAIVGGDAISAERFFEALYG